MLPIVLVSPAILEPLGRTLAWLLSLRDGQGRIVCPWHKVEHTGKSAGVIGLALALRTHDPDANREELLGVAVEQARRLVANLVNEPDSPCYTFRPGRHDPFNCSNSVIDGGACSDALAQLVREAGDELDEKDRDSFQAASLLHARTYLRYAVLDKGVPAQRAWGLAGLAGAWSLENDEDLSRAAIEAVGVLGSTSLRDEVEALSHDDESLKVREVAMRTLEVIGPGAMPFTRILRRAYSRARVRVRFCMPPLLTE